MENEEIRFGRFRLDLRRPELRRDGQPVRIHQRALGILCALAEAKGEIVAKDELMARLWPGRRRGGKPPRPRLGSSKVFRRTRGGAQFCRHCSRPRLSAWLSSIWRSYR